MRFLILFLLLTSSVVASTAKQMISICYFDEDRVQFNVPKMPNFMQGGKQEEIEKGYMIFYERKMFDLLSMFSFYGGANIGRYHKNSDTLYSASCCLASRFWILHLVLLHPYIEASFFGPTFFSKNEFNFEDLKSNFMFQNTLSIGAELGAGSGLQVELKAVKYFRTNLSHLEKGGIRVPLLLSVGYLF